MLPNTVGCYLLNMSNESVLTLFQFDFIEKIYMYRLRKFIVILTKLYIYLWIIGNC
jgi:hypothetical protein